MGHGPQSTLARNHSATRKRATAFNVPPLSTDELESTISREPEFSQSTTSARRDRLGEHYSMV